jgi:hypothetical protein
MSQQHDVRLCLDKCDLISALAQQITVRAREVHRGHRGAWKDLTQLCQFLLGQAENSQLSGRKANRKLGFVCGQASGTGSLQGDFMVHRCYGQGSKERQQCLVVPKNYICCHYFLSTGLWIVQV